MSLVLKIEEGDIMKKTTEAMAIEMKKNSLKKQMVSFIDVVLDVAAKEGKLDYIEIEISNHQGNLQMDYRLRDRKKVY